MDKKEFNQLIDKNFPETKPITESTRKLTVKESSRFRGAVRLSLGMFWTDERYEKHRKKILRTPLP